MKFADLKWNQARGGENRVARIDGPVPRRSLFILDPPGFRERQMYSVFDFRTDRAVIEHMHLLQLVAYLQDIDDEHAAGTGGDRSSRSVACVGDDKP